MTDSIARSTIRADFHVHTNWSPDAVHDAAAVVAAARAAGLDRVAITDHHEIRGAFAARALDPALVIVGEEITSDCGTDVIGLYLTERIPAGGSIAQIARAIRAQGGVVYAPHPRAYPTRGAERWAELAAVAEIVEGLNGRAFVPRWNRDAMREARAAGLPAAGGSDAHTAGEVGSVYTELPAFSSAADLREAAREARAVQLRPASVPLVACSMALHVGSRLAGWEPFRPAESRDTAWPPADVWGPSGGILGLGARRG